MLILLAIGSCSKQDHDLSLPPIPTGVNDHYNFNPKNIKIAVLSDLHYMAPSLLKADGPAFQEYLMQDHKLLAESKAIFEEIIKKLMVERPDLLLISGDLTKDGELVSHQEVIKQLKKLETYRIKVLVVPGNHDIDNPDAKLFDDAYTQPVATITPEKFKSLYADFGYRSAIAQDPNSLSYISEPFKDLLILALDANEYYNNTPTYCVAAGNIKDETMEWAKSQLAKIKSKKGKTVIGLMHHGIIEHFMGESVIFPDYLVDNREARADELMQAGVKVIFTGHFHANDAIMSTTEDLSLVDVETGSPVSYDSPYRIINLVNNKMYIKTKHIEHINYPGLNGTSFHNYSKAFTLDGFKILAFYLLTSYPYLVPEDLASEIAPIFAKSMLAHFEGDETISRETEAEIQYISGFSTDLADILRGFYTDLPPHDNELVIDLN